MASKVVFLGALKQGSHYLEPFDVPGRSLPPADFAQLSVRKSANCLFLIIGTWGLGETNLKKNTDSSNTAASDPSSSPAYQIPASAALSADRRNWKYHRYCRGVWVCGVALLDLTPLPQPFCVPLPLFTLSFSLLFLCGRKFAGWMKFCVLPLCLRDFADVWNINNTWQFNTTARLFPKASGAK